MEPLPKITYKKSRKPNSNTKQYAKNYCQYCAVHGKPEHENANIIDSPHHIENKGMGGSRNPAIHHPDNFITLCRYHHDCAHRKVKGEFISIEQLLEVKQQAEERFGEFFCT